MNIGNYILLIFLCLLQLHPSTGQETECLPEWPGFRGYANSGTWHTDLKPDTLTSAHFKKIWEVPVKPGYSGPTMSDNKVFVMDYDRETSKERVLCFHEESGEKLWEYDYPVDYASVGYPTGPRASAVVEGKLAFSFGTMGELHCFDASSGEVQWEINTREVYNSSIPIWGLAASPVIEGDLVIVQVGGVPDACLVAFNKFTGKEVWRALSDKASYSTPIIIEQGEKKVLVIWTGENIAGLDPYSGKVYWKIPFETRKMIMNVASPVWSPPYLFLTAFFDGSFLLKLNPERPEAELLWRKTGRNERETIALHSTISTPVIKEGYVYGIDSHGEVRCLDLLTGERIWEDLSLVREGRWSNIHFIPQDEKVWAFNETGELIYGEFTPAKFRNFGRIKLIDPVMLSPNPRKGVCWAIPAFYGNRIIVRNDEIMICYEIGE
ncbi:MAG: PQQ-binding-like beta-propeller repeat protein [Bacteroidales bacterium]